MRRPFRRKLEMLTYITPPLLLDLTMIRKLADVPLDAMLLSGDYDPSLLSNSTSSSKHYRTFLIPTLHNTTLSSPPQARGAPRPHASSSRRLVLELVTSLALHTILPLRSLHPPYNAYDAQLNPQVTNQMHVFERLGLVLLANFSLNVIGSHVLTRTVFVPVLMWLLVEIYSGLELPWGYAKVLPKGWGRGEGRG